MNNIKIRVCQNPHNCSVKGLWYVSRGNPQWDDSCYEDMGDNPQTMFQYLHLDGEWRNSMAAPENDEAEAPYFKTEEEARALAHKYGY